MRVATGLAALLLSGLGCTTIEATSYEPIATSEEEEIGAVEHALSVKLTEAFGEGARIQRRFGLGEQALYGVTTRAAPIDGDDLPAMGIAAVDLAAKEVTVLASEQAFLEARKLSDGVALVSAAGELRMLGPDGERTLLTQGVVGDLAPSSDGQRLALTVGSEGREGATAVALVNRAGELQVIADGDGVDDRPSLSPSAQRLVFVSGRTGIASLFVVELTADGKPAGEARQLTNAHLEPGVERTGEPEGFVPPPLRADLIQWVGEQVVQYDAGGGERWQVDIQSGAAERLGGAR